MPAEAVELEASVSTSFNLSDTSLIQEVEVEVSVTLSMVVEVSRTAVMDFETSQLI